LHDIHLVLAGSKKNGYKDVLDLCRRTEVRDAVIFLGYVPDVEIPGLYRHARALVMPTYFGPTNIPPLEAFVMGCPVACSNIYGMPEQLGNAALMFSPNSTDEIAEVIEKLWTDDDLCAQLVEKGRARVATWGRPQFNARFRAIVEDILTKPC
jgi:glycosyltransferase involved in cell wall biosynthesis